MLDKLKHFFQQNFETNKIKEPDPHTIQLVAAVLMFEVVKADQKIDDIELSNMGLLLQKHFNLTQQEVSELIRLAEHESEQAISLQGFTRQICDQWSNAQRCTLIEQLWVIALADGKLDAHERHIIRKVASLLYLNDKQIIQAKEVAKQFRPD